MPVEMVGLANHNIQWLEVTPWMDVLGGESRVGIALVDDQTPIFHKENDHSPLSKVSGMVLLQEGRNADGVPWIRVVHRGTDSKVTKFTEDIYEQVAE